MKLVSRLEVMTSLTTLAKALQRQSKDLLDLGERPLAEVREEQQVEGVEDVPARVQPLHQPGRQGLAVHVVGVKVLLAQGVLHEVLLLLRHALLEEGPARKLQVVLHEAHRHALVAHGAQLPEDVRLRVCSPRHDALQDPLCLQKVERLVHHLNEVVEAEERERF